MTIRVSLAALAAIVCLSFFAAPAGAFVDKDCSDFSSWRAAQHYYKKHGGPRHDPSRLDADHDGIACEDLM
jgi:excalibur calcium-binding domain-containing protein